jgi:hypothetical protein
LNVNVTNSSLNVNVTNTSLNVNVTNSTLTVTVSGTVNVNVANSQLNVNVTNTSITVSIGAPLDASGNLKTSIQSSVTLNVNITNCNVTLNVNITNSSLNVNVTNTSLNVYVTNSTLTVTVSGTVNVNVINSTLTVTISGTPTVNIQTSGGANIVIDKLSQDAYTEDRRTLSNNGATPTMSTTNSLYKRGKFFPRGCRGFINTVEIYCDNADSVSHTFTVKLSPMPGMGPVATFTLSVAAGSSAAWRSITVGRFWNYDSLFIWVSCDSDSYGRLGYDTGTPYDYYYSTDEVNWIPASNRWWFRVNLTGETVGDLPVSGIVNTVNIPNTSTVLSSSGVTVPSGTETSLLKVYGSGTLIEARASMNIATTPSSSVRYLMYIYCDGVLAYRTSNLFLTQSETATSGRSAIGEFVQASGITYMNVRVPLEFRRSIELRAYQSSGSTATPCYGDLIVSLIS